MLVYIENITNMRKKSSLCSSEAPQVSLYEYFIAIELAVWSWLRKRQTDRQTDRQSYFRIYIIGMDGWRDGSVQYKLVGTKYIKNP